MPCSQVKALLITLPSLSYFQESHASFQRLLTQESAMFSFRDWPMKSHYSCQVAAAIHNAALSLDGTYLGQGKRQKVCFSVLKDIGTSNW